MPQSNQHPSLTPNYQFDSFQANRSMNDTTGSNDSSAQLTTEATSSARTVYFHRFVSVPLDLSGGISANTWTYNFAVYQQSSNANFPVSGSNQVIPINCYVWRPSTQTKVGTILAGNSDANYSEPSQGLKKSIHGTFSGSAVSNLQNGDVIIFEVWFIVDQASATAYIIQWWMDGDTVTTTFNTTVSNHASFLETPQNLALATETVAASEVASKTLTNRFIEKV